MKGQRRWLRRVVTCRPRWKLICRCHPPAGGHRRQREWRLLRSAPVRPDEFDKRWPVVEDSVSHHGGGGRISSHLGIAAPRRAAGDGDLDRKLDAAGRCVLSGHGDRDGPSHRSVAHDQSVRGAAGGRGARQATTATGRQTGNQQATEDAVAQRAGPMRPGHDGGHGDALHVGSMVPIQRASVDPIDSLDTQPEHGRVPVSEGSRAATPPSGFIRRRLAVDANRAAREAPTIGQFRHSELLDRIAQ